ncbi:MAG: PEP/pyruvate-binding domain-containing protein [Patescibacteria group bacterium]
MKNLISPSEYQFPNSRIDGWKKLEEVRARIVDIHVFPLDIFKYFLEHKELPQEFVREVRIAAKKVIDESASHAALVRRAFVVPGLENPPGPRFLGLTTPEKVVTATENLFRFAIEQKYHEIEGNQISGWIEPPSTILNVDQFNRDPGSASIPYGGYGIPENGRVTIYTVFGINEGVQSLVADRYEIEFKQNRGFIIRKEIPQKNLMLCTTRESGSKLFQVPVEMQFDQILSDSEIAEVARVVHELSQKYGPQRVEFSTDEKGICFNEVADYWKEAKGESDKNLQIKGVVKVINNLKDFKKLGQIPIEDLLSGKTIVKISKHIITNRNYDILGALAAWKNKLYILYPGIAATQHAMRVLTDKGHKAFLIGNQKFEDGDEAQIVVTNGKVRVTNLSRTQSQKHISLWDASLLGVELCGGKADRLSKLKILGFQVPHGAVLTTLLFDEIIKKTGFPAPVPLKEFSKVYKLLKSHDQELIDVIDKLLFDYIKSDKVFAVRSSATIEDDSKNSMAGMFDTFLNISGETLSLKTLEVIRSAFSPKIEKYLKKDPSLITKLKMAIAVQEMVPARCAGVVFGVNVQTRNLDIVEIEANEGLGEGVVSGEAKEVEQYKFSRAERRLIEQRGPRVLSASEAKALFMLSERLRSEFGDTPQDIEWAIDKEGQVWVLQTRDLYLGQ